MKEFIYSRNAVYETLLARRRDVFKIELADNVQIKGKLAEIMALASQRKIQVVKAPRARLDKVHDNNQGIIAEVSGYLYSDMVEILELANQKNEPPFVLLLDSLNDPQNFGTLLRTAEVVGVHGVIIPLAHAVEVTPTVVNTSSGASEHLLIARSNLAQAIDALKEAEVWIVGLDQAGGEIEPGSRHLRGALGLVVACAEKLTRSMRRSQDRLLYT
jgi:23S rRNA (guanosine2251-2'-O)-methyltransferase